MSENGVTANFDGRYTIMACALAAVGSAKSHFGRKHWCRYCGCTDPAKFTNIAHLIPEGLGNHWLISSDECDRCNAKFSEYESNLISAVRPILTVGGTAGKANKVGQTGRTAGKSVIMHGNHEGRRQISIRASADETKMQIDPSSRHLQTSFPVAPVPFRPRLAYKALARIGYALLPDAELNHFTKLLAWLCDRNDPEDFPCLEVGISIGLLGNAPDIVSGTLLRRVAPTDKIPYMLFVLCAGSVCLMIDLMSDRMDDHLTWAPMGRVDINWSIVLGPNRELTINYGKFRPMNWASIHLIAQPIKNLVLDFNMMTTEGRFSAVFRDEWR